MLKNVASQIVSADLVAIADGTPVTTGTTTVYVTIDGGTQGTGSGTVTHEGNGEWSYAPTQAETNGNHVKFSFRNSLAIPTGVNVYPVAKDNPLGQAIADALLVRDFSSVTSEAARSALNALRFLRNKWSVATGTVTVTKEDDSTTAWTGAVSSDAGANPVTGVDPT